MSEAFKVRHEAYQTVHAFRDAVGDLGVSSYGAILAAQNVLQNPTAMQIIANDPRLYDNLNDVSQMGVGPADFSQRSNYQVAEHGASARDLAPLVEVSDPIRIQADDGAEVSGYYTIRRSLHDGTYTVGEYLPNGKDGTYLDTERQAGIETLLEARKIGEEILAVVQQAYDRGDQEPEQSSVRNAYTTEWTIHADGAWETRTHIGKSEEGWHYAHETSYQGSDQGGIFYSAEAFPTPEAAQSAADAALRPSLERWEQDAEDRENDAIAASERKEQSRGRGEENER